MVGKNLALGTPGLKHYPRARDTIFAWGLFDPWDSSVERGLLSLLCLNLQKT